MTDTPLPDDMTPETMLAMDFALGALDGPEMRAVELRLRRDPALAAEVARWQADLAPLAAAIPAVAPPPAVWDAIERELFRGAVPAAMPAARTVPAALRWWRALALGASAVAAIALGLLATRPPARTVVIAAAPAGTMLATSLAATQGAKAVLITATYDPARGTVVLTPTAQDASRGLTPELWLIVGKAKPRSLGVIDLKAARAQVVPRALRAQLTGGATLAISLEPAGGSPTGQPTGPVIAAGTLATI